MEKDINDVLRLNGIKNENGTFHDTSTEIVKGRRDTYQNARDTLELLMKRGKCTSKNVQEMIEELKKEDKYEEYIGVKLYYYQKKHDSMVRQGQ